MAYATISDVQARLTRTLSPQEQSVCQALLDDAGVLIDAYKATAGAAQKKVASCRMVLRVLGDDSDFPMGASQGSISGLGYSQSWTMGTGGASGELYLSKADKAILGGGHLIGSYSPVEEKVVSCEE